MSERHREEVLNTVLAACLGSRGANADPETIFKRVVRVPTSWPTSGGYVAR
jgi:hypothetical protein